MPAPIHPPRTQRRQPHISASTFQVLPMNSATQRTTEPSERLSGHFLIWLAYVAGFANLRFLVALSFAHAQADACECACVDSWRSSWPYCKSRSISRRVAAPSLFVLLRMSAPNQSPPHLKLEGTRSSASAFFCVLICEMPTMSSSYMLPLLLPLLLFVLAWWTIF